MSGGDDSADLASRLAAIDERVTSLADGADARADANAETSDALGGLSGEVAAISASLEEIRGAVEALQARDAGQDALLYSAVGALRDALRYTGPFSKQLDDVSRLAGDRAELQEALTELKPLADSGVSSLGELQRTFRQRPARSWRPATRTAATACWATF